MKAWVRGVPFDESARRQLENAARLPFIYRWIAAMPDAHTGIGATVGSVIPTTKAIVPAAVGVDIGCGMIAARTTLGASDLPESLHEMRTAIERAVPHGRTAGGGSSDRGAWGSVPSPVAAAWERLQPGYRRIVEDDPSVERGERPAHQLGTLGTGNHFIEVCLDESDRVWVLLHSGSRGIGNRIGTRYIARAKEELADSLGSLPDRDLAWLTEGTLAFAQYVRAVVWAQEYAATNRRLMLDAVLGAVHATPGIPPFTVTDEVVNCHHNYVAKERHYGHDVWITRKGAVRAGRGELGLIPGSMGACSYVVRGLGNPESFESCSHGAGRAFSRTEARRRFTLADHERATASVECRKDAAVIDETPAAYKPIEDVMAAQRSLVTIVHTLRQVVCVKG